jgi:hypothetical protein
MKSLSMSLMPVSIQGSGLLHTNWWTARDKADPKAEGVQAEGRRPEVGDLNISTFSLQPALPVALRHLPAMPHFNRVSVQETRQRNALYLLASIRASPWSVSVCRRTRQNFNRTHHSFSAGQPSYLSIKCGEERRVRAQARLLRRVTLRLPTSDLPPVAVESGEGKYALSASRSGDRCSAHSHSIEGDCDTSRSGVVPESQNAVRDE